MGEFVDQGDFGLASKNRLEVHLLERRAAVLARHARHNLEVANLRIGVGPVVGLHVANHDVSPTFATAVPLVEHPVGLANSGRGT